MESAEVSSVQESRQSGELNSLTEKTSVSKTHSTTTGRTFSAAGHRVSGQVKRRQCPKDETWNPSGLRCCGSRRLLKQRGLWSSNRPAWTEKSSLVGRKSFNALATGSQGELLIASTGCPSNAPGGFSSEEWEQRAWPYGITFTLTASENKGRTYLGISSLRAADSLGHVPTVCEAEFIQGFQLGSLHSWLREMQSQNRSRNGSPKGSSRASE